MKAVETICTVVDAIRFMIFVILQTFKKNCSFFPCLFFLPPLWELIINIVAALSLIFFCFRFLTNERRAIAKHFLHFCLFSQKILLWKEKETYFSEIYIGWCPRCSAVHLVIQPYILYKPGLLINSCWKCHKSFNLRQLSQPPSSPFVKKSPPLPLPLKNFHPLHVGPSNSLKLMLYKSHNNLSQIWTILLFTILQIYCTFTPLFISCK